MVSRRNALVALGGGLVPALRGQSSQRPPNFLLIFADDLGWGDVGFNGRVEWETPNLDRLAGEGVTFDRWYTGSPLCAPSRACMLTGKYGIHNGVRDNATDLPASEVTIAEALRPAGYTSAQIGKWHAGRFESGKFTHPLDQGFDYTFGYLGGRDLWEHWPKRLYRGREAEPNTRYSTDFIADESIRWMEQNKNRPFFLYSAFMTPHFKIEAPKDDVSRYLGKFHEKDAARPLNATYAAMIHRMDATVGKLVGRLDELGLAENTLIVFTSDNGATFEKGNEGASVYHDSNRPFRGQKRSLEEGGIRMPAFARWKGHIPAGKRIAAPIHTTDVFPTFLGTAGRQPDSQWGIDGRNMLDVWTGKAQSPDRTLFWEFQAEGVDMYAAMRGDFKLLVIGGQRYLYNLKDDPQERRTVAALYPEVFQRLNGELGEWLK